jgi:hypothetical protein
MRKRGVQIESLGPVGFVCDRTSTTRVGRQRTRLDQRPLA